MQDIQIDGDTIRLAQFLKLAGLVETGGDVKGLIAAGLVRVGDEVETRRARQLVKGDVVQVAGTKARVA